MWQGCSGPGQGELERVRLTEGGDISWTDRGQIATVCCTNEASRAVAEDIGNWAALKMAFRPITPLQSVRSFHRSFRHGVSDALMKIGLSACTDWAPRPFQLPDVDGTGRPRSHWLPGVEEHCRLLGEPQTDVIVRLAVHIRLVLGCGIKPYQDNDGHAVRSRFTTSPDKAPAKSLRLRHKLG